MIPPVVHYLPSVIQQVLPSYFKRVKSDLTQHHYVHVPTPPFIYINFVQFPNYFNEPKNPVAVLNSHNCSTP